MLYFVLGSKLRAPLARVAYGIRPVLETLQTPTVRLLSS
jgi:hypothetical protein